MNKKVLFALWGGLFILCGGLGFIPEPAGFWRGLMTALSVIFFLPGGALLYRGKKEGDRKLVTVIRNLSAASLGLTLVALVANFLCFAAPNAVGDGLYAVLVIVSSPMVCSGYWLLSLFLWACLLVVSLDTLKMKK
jgi:hypothetical protein